MGACGLQWATPGLGLHAHGRQMDLNDNPTLAPGPGMVLSAERCKSCQNLGIPALGLGLARFVSVAWFIFLRSVHCILPSCNEGAAAQLTSFLFQHGFSQHHSAETTLHRRYPGT